MYRFMVAVLLLLNFGTPAFAQDATENGEEKFVRLTHQLENAPLSDADKSIRTWLLLWATDSQEITVLACDVMDILSEEKTPNGSIYTTQMIFGNVAYQISNPDKKDDLYATQSAGVRSALKAYQSILAQDPQARIPHFDALLKKEQGGTLEDSLAPVVDKECSESGGA
jgi:hypothetical protein